MKASEVIKQYQNGQRNFQGQNLRGANFKEQDLSGADFSDCDIRGANFSNAILTKSEFNRATAGLSKRWTIIWALIIWFVSLIIGILSAFSGTYLGYIWSSNLDNLIAGWILIILWLLCSFFIFSDSLNIKHGLPVIGVFCFVFAVILVAGVGDKAIIVTLPLAVALIVARVIGFTEKEVLKLARITVLIGASIGIILFFSSLRENVVQFSPITGLAGIAYNTFLALSSMQENEKDADARKMITWLITATSSTSFYNATLTDADFSEATLKSTNFNQAILSRTCFFDAKKLELARAGTSILANPKVRDLLINPSSGERQDFFKADFRGANLKGVNLEGANLKQADLSEASLQHANLSHTNLTKADFRGANLKSANLKGANLKQADLSEASLQYANLSHANLTEVSAVATDFSHAYFTAACLEAWNINQDTKLDNIDCQYIFLLEQFNEYGSRERRPSSGDFQGDEFTKLFEEVLSTVDLIFRNGVDWKAFLSAMKQVQVQNEDTPLEIESISNKGDGVVVVKVKVSPDADKEKIHQEIIESYELKLDEVKKEYELLLKDKDNEHQKEVIALLREHNGDIKEIIKNQASPYNINYIINELEAKAMSDSNDSSKSIKAGRDVSISDSVVNLADTIGDVNYAIEQIADSSESKNDELKSLLKQLTEAIEGETELDDEEKADAAHKVKTIAEASQNSNDQGLQKKAKRAVNLLDTLAKGLEPAGKLANACKVILPKIIAFLGF